MAGQQPPGFVPDGFVPDSAPAPRTPSGTGAPAVEPSASGFFHNALQSGVNFGKNVIQGVAGLLNPSTVDKTVEQLIEAAKQPTRTGQLLKDAFMERYGSYDAMLQTAYQDPVGMASDLSLVLGGASKAAQGAGATRGARWMGAASQSLNPAAIPAAAAETLGRAAYTGAINPSRAIRQQFPGAMQEGYERNILPTQGGMDRAENALLRSATHTDARLAEADRLGAPRVTAGQITPAYDEPLDRAGLRVRAGLPDERPDLRARQAATRQSLQFGQSLSNANDIKREAQGVAEAAFRAQDRGAIIKDLDALATKNVAQAYRRAIEANAATVGVDDIAESNARTQALIGLTKALEQATNQPTRLTHLMATLEGVSQALGGSASGGAVGYTAMRAATSKPVMAGAGLTVGKSSKLLRNAQIMRALAVLYGAANPEQQGNQQE